MKALSFRFFFWEGWIGIAPTLIHLARSLSDAGHEVTILTVRNEFPDPGNLGSNTRVVYLPSVRETRWLQRIAKYLGVFGFRSVAKEFRRSRRVALLLFVLQSVRYAVGSRRRSPTRTVNVGIDANGSIAAGLTARLLGEPSVYLSLELNDPDRFQGSGRWVNALERWAFRKAVSVIIQDEERFETLCRYNRHRHPTVFFLPNAAAAHEARPATRGNFFRSRLGIPESEFPHLVLKAGQIVDQTYSADFARAFSQVRSDCALVYHERMRRDPCEPYLVRLREVGGPSFFLSLDPLQFDELHRIYSDITVGVAFYEDTGPNLSQIAKASGKLSYYLLHGKPVIVNNLPSLAALVERYGIGVVLNDPGDPEEIGRALDTILDDYEIFSANAKACFREEFDFARKAEPVLTHLTTR